MNTESIYNILPVFAQEFLVNIYGYYWKNRRYGGEFKNEVKQFRSRESFTKKEWENYQTIELRKLLVHAFETVPYYNKRYTECGFKKNDFLKFTVKDINRLPYLEKEDLRKFGTTSLLSNRKKNGRFYSSSGSTGKPVRIFISKEFHRRWNAAYEVRVRNWAGVNYKTSRGMIGGRRIMGQGRNTPPFFRYNRAEKQTYFSAYHISEANVENYLEGIVNNNVEYMVGYAMSNYFLADFIQSKNLQAPKLKAVITSSEKLTNEMRSTFKSVYSCKTYDGYSGVEACGLISENSDGDFLFSPDTGLMEIVDTFGHEVKNGEEGEIVATGLLNFDQPLIRYKIGDRAKKSENQRSKSGKEMLVVDEICGRVEDVVTSKDGNKMVRFHGIFIDILGLKLSQVVQESYSIFTIKLVVDSNEFNKDSERIIITRMKSQLGENIRINFKYVNDLTKTSNGKYRAVISKL